MNQTGILTKQTMTTTLLKTLADRINTEHAACESALKQGLAHAIEAGNLLGQVKDQVPHGEFAEWLKSHFAGSDRTARVYMRIHQHRDKLEQNGSALPLSLREANLLIADKRIAVAIEPTTEPCDDESGFIPPAGHFTLFTERDDGTGDFAVIMPSLHEGFFYVGAMEADQWNRASNTGTKRPTRAKSVSKFLPAWTREVEPTIFAGGFDVMGSTGDANPWTFNQFLFTSYEEWIRIGLLGQGVGK